MPPRTSLILVAVAIVSLLLAGLDALPPARRGGVAMFPALPGQLAAAERLEVVSHGQAATLLRQGEGWTVSERDGAAADGGRVRAVLAGMASLRLLEPRTAEAARLSRLGLNDPHETDARSALVRVLAGDGHELAGAVIGDPRTPALRASGAEPTLYVRRPDENQAWIAAGQVSVPPEPSQWLARDILSIPAEQVARLEIRRGGQGVVLERRETGLVMVEPPHPPPLDPFRVAETGRALEGLTLSDIRPATRLPTERIAEVAATLTDGTVLTFTLRADGRDAWMSVAGDGERGRAMTARLAPWAFRIAPERRRALAPTLDELRAYAPAAVTQPPP